MINKEWLITEEQMKRINDAQPSTAEYGEVFAAIRDAQAEHILKKIEGMRMLHEDNEPSLIKQGYMWALNGILYSIGTSDPNKDTKPETLEDMDNRIYGEQRSNLLLTDDTCKYCGKSEKLIRADERKKLFLHLDTLVEELISLIDCVYQEEYKTKYQSLKSGEATRKEKE
jgi:hypothetical protein